MVSISAWGKFDRVTGESHHLAHHSADVAATFQALLHIPAFRNRAERAAGQPLSDEAIVCLSALAFLHDIGKLAPAFQAKGWPDGHGVTTRDHLRCGWRWLHQNTAETALAGHAVHLARWVGIEDWFAVLFAHHGVPVAVPPEDWARAAFADSNGYCWKEAESLMGRAMAAWFPAIATHAPPPPTPRFAHHVAGLLALADWIGSDRRVFPFVASFEINYYVKALASAEEQLRRIGPDVRHRSLGGVADWALLSDHPAPRPAQQAVAEIDEDETLIILEAETGAGKTEAALWRFARLYQAGQVNSLYFAVPTRAAARQLQRRVNAALKRMFADPAPEAVLAIPGQMLSGEAQGARLPGFDAKWDDGDGAGRWAAEHATRYLAAQIAVGTVDQAMMAALQVRHASMRGAMLARSLLVIDEVHASDGWMTAIQRELVGAHRALGGHAMLMSATLGAVARCAWLDQPLPAPETAACAAYPAVWTTGGLHPVAADQRQKRVQMQVATGWSGADAARMAMAAAGKGARVLVIRNTVDRARETWRTCVAGAPQLVLSVNDTATLHHSRFAAEDRALLDAAVEAVLGKASPARGVIVIGTQTLEQSLDIDADLLITDLAPMDVLLQRIGRLHRHDRTRPAGFEQPRAILLTPPQGLDLLTRVPENGLGALASAASLSGVYTDVPGLAATLQQAEEHPVWAIPQMNRALVEAATHPANLSCIAEAHGWGSYLRRMTGKALAETKGAELVLLKRAEAFPASFPSDAAVRTRLGAEGALLALDAIGPFGQPISRIALPAHWSHGVMDDRATVLPGAVLTICAGERRFRYGADGLSRDDGD